jgi:hypothetical protein
VHRGLATRIVSHFYDITRLLRDRQGRPTTAARKWAGLRSMAVTILVRRIPLAVVADCKSERAAPILRCVA